MKGWKILTAIAICLFMNACEPGYTDELDGKWQLREIVYADGSTSQVDTVWYNFQTSLFMYQYYDKYEAEGIYHQNYGYKYRDGKKNLDLELTTYGMPVDSFLIYTDWTSSRRSFVIESHSNKNLVLSSEGKRYYFHKF